MALLLAGTLELFFVNRFNAQVRLRCIVLDHSRVRDLRCIGLVFDRLHCLNLLADLILEGVVVSLLSNHLVRFSMLLHHR